MGAGLLQTRWYSVGAPWGQFCPQGTLAVSGDIFGCPTVGWRMLAAARGWMLVNTLECPGRPLREERTGPKCPQCLAPRLRTQPARCAALCWQDPSAGDQHPTRADGCETGRPAKCTPLAPCTLSRSLPRQVWTSPPAWAEAQSSEDGNTPPAMSLGRLLRRASSKASDLLTLSPGGGGGPPSVLDGEIVYSKNNVCVHPPEGLQGPGQHHPGEWGAGVPGLR